jgi:chitin synthase
MGTADLTNCRCISSVAGYTTAMVGFAIITVYMVAAAGESCSQMAFIRMTQLTYHPVIRAIVYLAVVGIKAAVNDGTINVSDYTNADQTFRNIVLSLIATYGIYILASILALDPWHLLTSFPQYLLVRTFMAPSQLELHLIPSFCF